MFPLLYIFFEEKWIGNVIKQKVFTCAWCNELFILIFCQIAEHIRDACFSMSWVAHWANWFQFRNVFPSPHSSVGTKQQISPRGTSNSFCLTAINSHFSLNQIGRYVYKDEWGNKLCAHKKYLLCFLNSVRFIACNEQKNLLGTTAKNSFRDVVATTS